MNKDWITKSYKAENVASWKAARNTLLTSPKARNIFANKLTDTVGLTSS